MNAALPSDQLTPDTRPPWVLTPALAELGPEFFSDIPIQPLQSPHWVAISGAAAQWLGLPQGWSDDPKLLLALSGNAVLAGSRPVASVYSGHQFGVWAGQLGDGRAVLLGECETPSGERVEVQLKGSGRTPYSRMGDGRAVLRSSIREFLASEALHALGIPTTRALALTGSPSPVRREEVETAAVVTRLSPSFLRFGHFEHFSANEQWGPLRKLADYTLDRFYPECRRVDPAGPLKGNAYAALLQAVTLRTAHLLAQWQAVGFCHGVMNTDNMSMLGLTIDYGPFQFLDGFDPGHICNHSDASGRYAYGRQPNVAYWNLFCLGQALLPLIEDQEVALAALETYKAAFPAALLRRMGDKLGLVDATEADRPLIDDLLRLLAAHRVDYPVFWRRLSHAVNGDAEPVRDLMPDREAFDAWWVRYQQRLGRQDRASTSQTMLAVNPRYVLRNHLGEQAIAAARTGDFAPVQRLLAVLQNPFAEQPEHADLADVAPDWAASIEISCSS